MINWIFTLVMLNGIESMFILYSSGSYRKNHCKLILHSILPTLILMYYPIILGNNFSTRIFMILSISIFMYMVNGNLKSTVIKIALMFFFAVVIEIGFVNIMILLKMIDMSVFESIYKTFIVLIPCRLLEFATSHFISKLKI